MKKNRVLWVDDEIEYLKPHILFLIQKGYEVDTVNNGVDAVERCKKEPFDVILLDEHMTGISGLKTLELIKEIRPSVPVIMVTKSEEENIMDKAIGRKIADYLIKPVNPNQILLSLKRNLHLQEIESAVHQIDYAEEFRHINSMLETASTADEWMEIYRRSVRWELELEDTKHPMAEMLLQQKDEANKAFSRFVSKNYLSWMKYTNQAISKKRPTFNTDIFKEKIFPLLDQKKKIFLLVLDNYRYDLWRSLMPKLSRFFLINEELYFSILPTTTQYARNSLFSGLFPDEIIKRYPLLWTDEEDEENKNNHEEQLLANLFQREGREETFSYHKLFDAESIERLILRLPQMDSHPLNIAVVNFIDMLSHGRTENKTLRELSKTESAYRSITQSWFLHSPLYELLRRLSEKHYTVIMTTDHGSIKVNRSIKIQCNSKDCNNNLRYKVSKNISYNPKEVFEIDDPTEAHLPSPNLSSRYIFATGKDYLSYTQHFNLFAKHYEGTLQHGGISMEEMIIPFITMESE